jgi:hypothetical protein
MLFATLFRQRAKRLNEKFRDLRSTTGSSARAYIYVAKYIIVKMGFLAIHMALAFRRRRVRSEVVKAQTSFACDASLLIAIKLTGGIGDLIVIARFVRDLLASSEPLRFDVYYKDTALVEWIFEKIPGFHAVYSEFLFDHLKNEYPLALWVSQFVVFYSETAQWSVLREYRKLMAVLQNMSNTRSYIEPTIAAHPYMDGYLSQKAVYMNFTRATFLQGLSKIPYGGDILDLRISDRGVEKYGLKPKQYLTIHNGFDPAFVITSKSATKCYPHFAKVVQLIKDVNPKLKIVQIGVGTSTPILGVDINLIDQLTIQESTGLLKHALLHIDNEGGLVHIARCLGVRSCVVFGPTPVDYFGYPDNLNLRPPICGGCWWINQTWMDQCPRGFDVPICMESHIPEAVASAVNTALAQNQSAESELLNSLVGEACSNGGVRSDVLSHS